MKETNSDSQLKKQIIACSIGLFIAGLVFGLRVLIAKIGMCCGCYRFTILPSGKWDNVFLWAMLISIFCAYTFYADFPRSYQNLEMGEVVRQMINFFLPYLQIVLGIASILSIGNYYWHMFTTLGYFSVFLFWDYFIFRKSTKPKKDGHKENAEHFKKDAWKYFLTIDLPTFVTFALMLVIAHFVMNEKGIEGVENLSIFMSGVVGSQAIAASISVGIKFNEV